MRIPYTGLFIILLANLSVDWYICRFLRTNCRSKVWSGIQFWSALIFNAGIISLFFMPVKSTSDAAIRSLMWTIFIYISVYVPKYIFVIFDTIARIPELWKKQRLKAVSWTGAIIGFIIFFALWWGALVTRTSLHVEPVTVEISDLPSSFENFKIAQISDLHVGTYSDGSFLKKIVETINEQKPDVVLFTGDIVNRHTNELEPYTKILSGIKAPYGVYSVLGNHDYGDYYAWADSLSRDRNNDRLAELQKNMGWTLLKNDYQSIAVGNDSLVIVGVENIGDPPFHVYGSLLKAYPTPEDDKTKIMLSHNPAHWVNEIADSDYNIALTLSGHTHAMQISLFGWSPASFRYHTWGGLYHDDSGKHSLYVNIGTGTVGFPARIGATPEITLITLKKK